MGTQSRCSWLPSPPGARRRSGGSAICWVPACAAALVLANAADYASALWDPIVAGIAVLTSLEAGANSALRRGLAIVGTWAAFAAGLLLAGGSLYWQSVMHARPAGPR